MSEYDTLRPSSARNPYWNLHVRASRSSIFVNIQMRISEIISNGILLARSLRVATRCLRGEPHHNTMASPYPDPLLRHPSRVDKSLPPVPPWDPYPPHILRLLYLAAKNLWNLTCEAPRSHFADALYTAVDRQSTIWRLTLALNTFVAMVAPQIPW